MGVDIAPVHDLTSEEDGLLAIWLEPVAAPGTDTAAEKRTRLRFARWHVTPGKGGKGAWSPAVTVAESRDILRNWADFPAITSGPGGALIAHFAEISDRESFSYDVVLMRSDDGGRTWRRIGLAHGDETFAEHGFVSLLHTSEGVRAFWLDGRARGRPKRADESPATGDGQAESRPAVPPPMGLRTALVATSAAPDEGRPQAIGAEQLTDQLIDPRVCDCCGTAAAMTARGPVIVYRDRSADEVRDISIIRSVTAGAGDRAGSVDFSRPEPVHRDGWKIAGCPVNGPRVAAKEHQVAVAWYTYAGSRPRVLVAFSADSGAHFAAPVVVDRPAGARAPIGRVDIAMRADGREVVVSWLASERENAVLLARRISVEGRLGAVVKLADTRASRAAGFPRIELVGGVLFTAWVAGAHGDADRSATVQIGVQAEDSLPAPATGADASEPPANELVDERGGLVATGARVPSYRVRSLAGAPIELRDQLGKGKRPILLNIWATWCEPCRSELPELIALHEKYSARGLRIIGSSVDRLRTTEEIAKFAARRRVPFDIWHDREDLARSNLGVDILPASLLIAPNGTILFAQRGAVRADDTRLSAAIEAALGAASTP